MLKSFIKWALLAIVTVPLLSACESSSQTRRPVTQLNSDSDRIGRSTQGVVGSNSGVQVYGTIDTGYGFSRTKTTITDSDGNRRTIRSSRSGLHNFR